MSDARIVEEWFKTHLSNDDAIWLSELVDFANLVGLRFGELSHVTYGPSELYSQASCKAAQGNLNSITTNAVIAARYKDGELCFNKGAIVLGHGVSDRGFITMDQEYVEDMEEESLCRWYEVLMTTIMRHDRAKRLAVLLASVHVYKQELDRL